MMSQGATLTAGLPAPVAEALKTALRSVPMNATVGVKITEVGVGWATGECADTAPFRNHMGTIHAGAQFLLAEAVTGAAFAGAFAAHIQEAVPLIEKLETHYVGRAVGDITARAEANAADLAGAYAQYQEQGKARLILQVTVQDGEHKDVMQATAHWYIRRRPAQTVSPSSTPQQT